MTAGVRGPAAGLRAAAARPACHTLGGNVPASSQGLEGAARPGDGGRRAVAEQKEPQGPPEAPRGARQPEPFAFRDCRLEALTTHRKAACGVPQTRRVPQTRGLPQTLVLGTF